MPLRALKIVVLESETRTLEFFLALSSAVWGLWLLYSTPAATTAQFWSAVNHSGGISLWITWALFNFFFQLMTVLFRYPMMRRYASSSCAIYWLYIALAVWKTEPKLFTLWMALGIAMGQLWVVLHRSAVGK